MTEAEAYRLLEELYWPDGPVCPHCGHTKAYFIAPTNGISRRTASGTMSERRIWRCAACRKQFSVLVGSPLQNLKVPLTIALASTDALRLPTREAVRQLGVDKGTVYRLRQRLGIAS